MIPTILDVAKAIHYDLNPTRDWNFEAQTMQDFYLRCSRAAFKAMAPAPAEVDRTYERDRATRMMARNTGQ